ncbi:MAG: AI-2E family transporter [Lachnospiraceae bacterium]|nr:AI-2E family transporter [Lachnospiraceae bacterium]
MSDRRDEKGLLGKPMILTLLITGGVILIVMLLKNSGILAGLRVVARSLQALFFGILFAYLLNPVARFFERKFKKWLSTEEKPRKKLCQSLALVAAVLIFVGIVLILIISIVPQLLDTIKTLMQNSSRMIRDLVEWMKGLSASDYWQEKIVPSVQNLLSDASGWLGTMAGESADLIATISNGIMSVLKIILNCVVGLIIAIYILISKEKLIAQVRKLTFALFPSRQSVPALEIMSEANRILEGYLVGKIIDSLIIGMIALVGMFVLRLPYVLLISAAICITNMIPFFGPYIGAVIGSVLILMVNPIQTIYFLIFVLVLQQVDGNIIGPKILGSSTGLDPMWIVVAVMAFGGCFGFVGMILGVPVFAWIYYIVKRVCEYSLTRKGLPGNTDSYYRGKESPEVVKLFDKAATPAVTVTITEEVKEEITSVAGEKDSATLNIEE